MIHAKEVCGSASRSSQKGRGKRVKPAVHTSSTSSSRSSRVGDDDKAKSSQLWTCGICGRNSDDPNRMLHRHPGKDCLVFANSTTCLSCKNVSNSSLVHTSASVLRKEASSSSSKKAEMREFVEKWEDKNDSCKGHFKDDGTLELPTWLDIINDKISRDITVGLVFWPESVLIRKAVEYAKADLENYKDHPEQGIMRDHDLGLPSGTVKVENESANIARKKSRVGSTDTKMFDSEVDDKWSAMEAGTGRLAVTTTTDAAGKESLAMEVSRQSCDDGGWDDLLPNADIDPAPVEKPPAGPPPHGNTLSPSKGGRKARPHNHLFGDVFFCIYDFLNFCIFACLYFYILHLYIYLYVYTSLYFCIFHVLCVLKK